MSKASMLAESFRKVFYDLRPGKQIERRLLLDAFQSLINAGFKLKDATYLGFGSVFFYDFAMFYRYLGFHEMISLEQDISIKPRIEYNKPYENIRVEFKSASDFIPSIDRDRKYVAWFDYDYVINEDMLADVVGAAAALSVGSIFLITVDGKPSKHQATPNKFRAYIKSQAKDFLLAQHTDEFLMPSNLAAISRDLLSVAITKGLVSRPAVKFAPLFSILYDDSRPMYTFGGMIVDASVERQLSTIEGDYLRTKVDDPIFEIEVPRLTRKERFALDQSLPGGKIPFGPSFGITKEEIEQYARVFRYFPSYTESL